PDAAAALPAPWRAAFRDRLSAGPLGLDAALRDAPDETARAAWIRAYDALDLVPREPDVVAARLRDEADVVRVAAITALGRVGRRADLATMAEFLADESPELRRSAAAALYPHATDLI